MATLYRYQCSSCGHQENYRDTCGWMDCDKYRKEEEFYFDAYEAENYKCPACGKFTYHGGAYASVD